MSVSVSLKKCPPHVRQSAYFPVSSTAPGIISSDFQQQNIGARTVQGKSIRPGVVPFSFPATTTALWDKTPTGVMTTLHITKERSLYVHILEKTLRLAYRHASQQSPGGKVTCRCFLIGQALNNADDDGLTITIDRFDPGHNIPGRSGTMPTAKLPGDHVIPLAIDINKEFDSTTHTEDDFKTTFELLQHNCCSRGAVDVTNLVSLRIHCCCYANDDDITFSLHVAGVTIATALNLTPISAIPIIPTALARNLQGPLNLGKVQGTPKTGFVTLDETRKLLLLLESDPKAYSLPLVGIWLSGVSYLASPVIWATCLRYMFNSSIQDRVCNSRDGFLVIIFTPSKCKPEFYQCSSLAGGGALTFQLVGCRENLHVFKHADVTHQPPVQLELRTARDGPNKSIFLQADKQFKSVSCNTTNSKSGTASTGSRMSEVDDDIQMLPRPSPKPIMDKSPTVRPSVPELSLVFDDFGEPQLKPTQTPYMGHDEVFFQAQSSSKMQTIQPHHKENSPQTKPAHFIRSNRKGQARPGPLMPIDQNSPHHTGRQANFQNGGGSLKSPLESQPRLSVGNNCVRTGGGIMQRTNSEPLVVSQGQVHAGQQQETILRQNATDFSIGQENADVHAAANKQRSYKNTNPSFKQNVQRSNLSQTMAHSGKLAVADQRRASAPVSRQASTASVIGKDLHKRQSLASSRRHSHHKPGSPHSIGSLQPSVAQQMQNSELNQQSTPPTSHTIPVVTVPHASPLLTRNNHDLNTRHIVPNTMDIIPAGLNDTTNTKVVQSSPNRVPSTNLPFASPSSSEMTAHPYSQNVYVHQLSTSGSLSTPNAGAEKTHNCVQTGNVQFHNEAHRFPVCSQPDGTPTGIPMTHTESASSQHQRGQDTYVIHSSEGTPKTLPSHSPVTSIDGADRQHQRGQDTDSGHSKEGSLQSQNAYEQLRRQEQMIKELQNQIQMLLKTQQAASLLQGVLTPPATPTSTSSANQNVSTPIKYTHVAAYADSPASNDLSSRPVNHHSSPTRLVATATSPRRDDKCTIGVNTGQSLFWPAANDAVKKHVGNLPAESSHQKSSQHRSPQHLQSANKDTGGNSTFDLESDPNLSLVVEGAEMHSGTSMIGPIEMNSSLDTGSSKLSSPKQNPERRCGSEDDSSHPSDSFRSPVLGESASTYRPPGRPLVSSDSEDDVSKDPGTPSLLYKDQKKFYANILGNVQQLLDEPTKTDRNQSKQKTSSCESASDDSSSESSEEEDGSDDSDSDDVATTTKEELGILGLKLSLPEDLENGLLDKSAVYRSMNNTSPDFFPRINYVSILDLTLDSPNLSMEANALAMKYLSDDELAKLSIGFKSQSAPTPRKDVNPLLRTALVSNLPTDKSTMGVSSVGFPSVDMSMASRKYMEKYGLLEIGRGGKKDEAPTKTKKLHSSSKKKIKKKTSKRKTLTVDSPQQCDLQKPAGEVSVAPEHPVPDKAQTVLPPYDQHSDASTRIRATPTLQLNSQQVSPISQTANETYEPWLKRPPKKVRDGANTGAFQMFANNQAKGHNIRGQGVTKPVGNILDISRLQELPKLL